MIHAPNSNLTPFSFIAALAEIKDALAARGDPKAELLPENNENCYKIFSHQ